MQPATREFPLSPLLNKQPYDKAAHPPRASELLEDLLTSFEGDGTVSVQDVLNRFEGRAFGLLMLLLALPNCIPNVPGLSTIFGILLLAPAIQLIIGSGSPWLPKRLRAMTIQRETLRTTIKSALPTLKKFEVLIKPRWEPLTERPVSIALGFMVLICALILMLPIPLGNWLPGMCIAAIALALLQRDGVLSVISIGFFIASFAILPLGIGIGLAAISYAWEWLSGGWMSSIDYLAHIFEN